MRRRRSRVFVQFWIRFSNFCTFSQVLREELVLEGHVRGLWKHALFLQDGQDAEWFFNEFNRFAQIHSKVDHNPLDSFLFVLFLLQDKHVMVEELLQLLIRVVNAKLLESVEFEDFETGNVENTNEEGTRQLA